MDDMQTPEVRYISVQPYFRQQGASKRLIREHERAAPSPKEKPDGNTRKETS